jgi:ribosomal protein S18 acetylase RimI-like enzyme
MHTIERLTGVQAAGAVEELIDLLGDAVDDGASLGFLTPLTDGEARHYWEEVVAGVGDGSRVLLVRRDGGRVVGSVQLALARQKNGSHRAEVQKLMVHRSARRRGLGRTLMEAVEAEARRAGRTLLVLDTRRGDPSERLYLSRGYTPAGIIPRYARSSNGSLHDTVLFYRILE